MPNRTGALRALALVAVTVAALATASATAAGDYAFTVVAPRSLSASGVVARVLLDAPATCPRVIARTRAGKTVRLRMQRLATPAGTVGFDGVVVCRRALPAGLTRARALGRRLPLLPPGTPQHIALLGDTGCRIKVSPPTPPATETSYDIQNCNSPSAWPLASIAGEIASAKPDVVIDSGDFFYRESPCPAVAPYEAYCAGSPAPNPPGSPNEDTWAGWEADWFRPARPLFAAAPLLLARGNHESCSRAGTGWFLLLDPGVGRPDTCQLAYPTVYDPEHPPAALAEPTWVARLGSLDVAVLDSSNADDSTVQDAATYEALGEKAVRLLRPRSTGWLLTHRPVYGWERFGGPGTAPIWTNATLEAALDSLIGPFAAVVSGHLHLFQTVQLPDRPGQLTLGDGGTQLDPADQGGDLPAFGPPGAEAPTAGVTTFTFGWTLLRPAAKRGVFTGTRFEAGVGPWAACRVAPHDVSCVPLR